MKDKIFVLSNSQVINLKFGFAPTNLCMDPARMRANTAFVAEQPEMGKAGETETWWIRSHNCSSNAMSVDSVGYFNQKGICVDYGNIAVCPALRLNLSSSLWSYAGTVCTDGTGREVPFEKKMQSVTLKNPDRNKTNSVTYDCVWFGRYPQTDATGANMEPIKWRVLEVKGGIALLHADKNLDTKPYNKVLQDVTWKNCSLRSWLNGYGPENNICNLDYRADNFLSRAFTPEEQMQF